MPSPEGSGGTALVMSAMAALDTWNGLVSGGYFEAAEPTGPGSTRALVRIPGAGCVGCARSDAGTGGSRVESRPGTGVSDGSDACAGRGIHGGSIARHGDFSCPKRRHPGGRGREHHNQRGRAQQNARRPRSQGMAAATGRHGGRIPPHHGGRPLYLRGRQ